jgi:hypothetical protein
MHTFRSIFVLYLLATPSIQPPCTSARPSCTPQLHMNDRTPHPHATHGHEDEACTSLVVHLCSSRVRTFTTSHKTLVRIFPCPRNTAAASIYEPTICSHVQGEFTSHATTFIKVAEGLNSHCKALQLCCLYHVSSATTLPLFTCPFSSISFLGSPSYLETGQYHEVPQAPLPTANLKICN